MAKLGEGFIFVTTKITAAGDRGADPEPQWRAHRHGLRGLDYPEHTPAATEYSQT
jgi:hypothetical protein